MNRLKTRLKEILIQNSYQKKEIKLASGRLSDFYFDGKQTSLHPEGAYLIGRLFYEAILCSGRQVEAIGGPTLGADPIVSATSLVSHLHQNPIPAFIIRKEPKKHGTSAWIEGEKNLNPFMKVALVEDVITSGGSLLKAIEQTEKAGYFVSLLLTLVDREEGGRENLESKGYKLVSLFTKTELLA